MMSNEEKILAMLVELKESTDKRFDTIEERLDEPVPKNRLDELESDVVVLKTAVKMLAQEIAELKKAQ